MVWETDKGVNYEDDFSENTIYKYIWKHYNK